MKTSEIIEQINIIKREFRVDELERFKKGYPLNDAVSGFNKGVIWCCEKILDLMKEEEKA